MNRSGGYQIIDLSDINVEYSPDIIIQGDFTDIFNILKSCTKPILLYPPNISGAPMASITPSFSIITGKTNNDIIIHYLLGSFGAQAYAYDIFVSKNSLSLVPSISL